MLRRRRPDARPPSGRIRHTWLALVKAFPSPCKHYPSSLKASTAHLFLPPFLVLPRHLRCPNVLKLLLDLPSPSAMASWGHHLTSVTFLVSTSADLIATGVGERDGRAGGWTTPLCSPRLGPADTTSMWLGGRRRCFSLL